MDVLIAEAGLVGLIFGLIRKFELETRVSGFLYDLLVCNFCTIFWISVIVCTCFLNPFHAITITGIWTLASLR